MRIAVVFALLWACGAPPATMGPRANTPPADGTILERSSCSVVSAAELGPALDAYYREDIIKAGLEAQLAAHPLTSIVTEAERERMVAAAKASRCERVIYASDGLRVTGFVVHPTTGGRHPVVVWLRGGNRAFGQIEPVTLLNLAVLADAGFVVVATQYRGVDGGEGHDEFGGAEVDDVLSLVPLARSLPDADVARLYVFGGSRGAMEGSLALRRGLPARAAAFRAGLFDLPRALTYRRGLVDGWKEMMTDYAANPDAALSTRSAIKWPRELRVPVLLLHGRQDWRVKLADDEAFDAALAGAGLEHRLVVYDDDEHQLAFHRTEYLNEVVAWFRSHGAFD